MPYTAADLDWLAQNPSTAEGRRLDAMAGEAMATSRLEMKLCF